MAKIQLKEGTGITSLSGTYKGMTFKTLNGQVIGYVKPSVELKPDATRAEKARYRRHVMVDACVEILQDEMEDFLQAISLRRKMCDRLKRLYDSYAPEVRARRKLQKRILREYRARFCTDYTSTKAAQ